MEFNRIDIAEAYYLFFAHYHGGQWSTEYKRLSKMSRWFKPRPMLNNATDLTTNGQEIYDHLVAQATLKWKVCPS
jgi:hypothetical protein